MDAIDHYLLPEPSTSIVSGIHLESPGGSLSLVYDYDRDGKIYTSGLNFNKVRAYSHVADIHTPAWKIEVAYDQLKELERSDLVTEILNDTPDDQRQSWVLKHFLIYFDGGGCFDVIAESWEVIGEKEGYLSDFLGNSAAS